MSAGDAQLVAPSLRAIAELARAQAPKKLLASAECLLTEGGSNPAEIKTDILISGPLAMVSLNPALYRDCASRFGTSRAYQFGSGA